MRKDASGTSFTMGYLDRGLEPNATYNRKSWQIICALAKEKHSRLLLIAGNFFNDLNVRDMAHPAVFHLLNPRLIDGAIVSQTVFHRATADHLTKLNNELPQLPFVSLTNPLGTRPCVQIDHAPGLRQLLRHLIEVHGCRRIVHVRGPSPNHEADERETVWREELSRAGIALEESWLVKGDWDRNGLPRVGQDILDQNGTNFDAVVACNDTAALKIIEDLQKLGRRIPEDHLVCGFDDIDHGQYSRPSLTTVRQPRDLQIRRAWDAVEALRSGRNVDSVHLSETELVIRQSCSCPPEAWDPHGFPLLRGSDDVLAMVSLHEAAKEEFEWAVFDLHNFLRDLNQVSQLDQLAAVLQTWFHRLRIPSYAILQVCGPGGEAVEHECLWTEGVLLPTSPDYFRVLTCSPDPVNKPPLLIPREIFSLDPWFPFSDEGAYGLFPLVVGNVWYGLAVLELSEQAGLVELTLQEQLASLMNRLSREAKQAEAAARARARELVRDETAENLGRLVAEVAHETNTPLAAIFSSHETQSSVLQSWRERNLPALRTFSDQGWQIFDTLLQGVPWSGEPSFPAGSWKFREELTSRLTALQTPDPNGLADNLTSLGCETLPDAWTSPEALVQVTRAAEFARDLADFAVSAHIVEMGAKKIANFVSKLRSTTRVYGVGGIQSFDIKESLETAALLLTGDLKRGLTLVWEPSPVGFVQGRPDEIQLVWTNLLRNAFYACDYRGEVRIEWHADGPFVRVDVVDFGPGIPPDLQPKVFTPFFTTKPQGEGLGLGLDLCRKIVESFGGRIEFESDDRRTVFSVWLSMTQG